MAMTLFPATAFGASPLQILNVPGCNEKFISGWVTAACIAKLIGHIVAVVFQLVSILFVINVMFAGYQMALGYISGDKAQGVERLRYSIIGLIVCVCVYLIIDLALNILLGS